jgi:hypothetical protein
MFGARRFLLVLLREIFSFLFFFYSIPSSFSFCLVYPVCFSSRLVPLPFFAHPLSSQHSCLSSDQSLSASFLNLAYLFPIFSYRSLSIYSISSQLLPLPASSGPFSS